MLKFWGVAVVVLSLDQGAKLLVQRWLEPGQSVPLAGEMVRLSYVLNPGGAFGILGDRQTLLVWAGVLVVAVVVAWFPRIVRDGFGLPAGLLLGGAVGNLIDRVRLGKVIDFIDLGFWPVFNVADIAVVAGAVLLGFSILWREKNRGEHGGHA